MYQGWNLVGPAQLYDMPVEDADLVGYSHVISPGIHQTYWTYLRDESTTDKNFVPTEGYWVYMVNQGTLAGFTSTPITE